MAKVQPEDRTPILVGCGQLVQKEKDVEKAKSPMDLMADAARLAAADTGLGEKLWPIVDNITVVRFITDSPDSRSLPFGRYRNAPKTLGNLARRQRLEELLWPDRRQHAAICSSTTRPN